MHSKLEKAGYSLWLLFTCYTVISYLIFLRNDFLLERISLLTKAPWILNLGRHWGKLLHVNSIPTPLYFITIIAMFVVYLRALHVLKEERKKSQNSTKNIIIKFAILFLVTTLLSFPALSTDVFDYIATNRVLFVHQANPWLHPPQDFPQDEFIYLGSWKFRASVYGPVQFLTSSLVYLLAGSNIILNIIAFKVINVIFTVAVIILVKKLLEEKASSRLVFGLAVFAWNPLLHIEIIGNAHNDIIMTFFSVLGLYLVLKKRESWGAFALAAAVLAKIAAALFVPIIAFWLIGKGQKRKALKFLAIFITATLIGFASLGKGFLGLLINLGDQLGLYLRSLPTILRFLFLKVGLQNTKAMIAEKILTIPPFIAIFVILIRKIRRTSLIPSLVIAMLSYLIISSPMLQPWYLIWVLPFVSLLPPGRLQNGAIIFSFTSLIYYSILFISFYFSPLNFVWQIIMFTSIVVPPLLSWFTPKSWYTQINKKKLFLS